MSRLRFLRSKWVRWPLILWAVYLVASTAFLITSRYWVRSQGEKELAPVVARLDAEEPGWRWADIEAARGPLPDPKATDGLPARFAIARKNSPPPSLRSIQHFKELSGSSHRKLRERDAEELEESLEDNQLLVIALGYQKGPGTNRRVVLKPDNISTLLPDTGSIEDAVGLLGLDAERLAGNGKMNEAFERLRAMLNAERSIGNEPFAGSQFVRMHNAFQVARRTERMLGLGQPTRGLAELQAELLTEAEVNFALTACRGERASIHEMYLGLETGGVRFRTVFSRLSFRSDDAERGDLRIFPTSDWECWLYKKYLPANHAESLRWLTRSAAACRRPEAEHPAAVVELAGSEPKPGRENLFCRLITPRGDRLLAMQLSTRAWLRCAAAGLAAEQFRQRMGRWPTDLAEVPPDILPKVPTDPFNGEPLGYRTHEFGAEVFSVGAEVFAESRRVSRFLREFNSDPSFQLFDVKERGLPAIEPRFWDDEDVEPELGPPPREVKPVDRDD
jgi:hypothetical protein